MVTAQRERVPRKPDSTPLLPLTAEDERLPNASRPRAAQLLALIEAIEARADAGPLLASAIVEVRQMRVVHLPRLLETYANIAPRSSARPVASQLAIPMPHWTACCIACAP